MPLPETARTLRRPNAMPEIPLTSLPVRLQKQYESARTAVARDNPDYAINICLDILAQHPGCLAVRRLLRATQLKVFRSKNRLIARAAGALAATNATLQGRPRLSREPGRVLEIAEKALCADPTNTTALRLLAEAAVLMELGETATFALESVIEQSGESRADLVRLAGALVAAGRSPEALKIAERLLKAQPGDGELVELVKRASVEQSIAAGRWDSGSGTYRDKLRDEQRAVSLEQSEKIVSSEEMAARLVDEAIARIGAEPDNLNHYRTAVTGLQALGRFDDALLWLGRARARPTGAADPTLERLESDLRIARVQRQLDDRVKAVAVSGGRVQDDAEVARLRGELSAMRIAALRAVVDRFPNELGQRFELGQLYRQTGEIDLALQQFQAAQRSPSLRLQAIAALGSCFRAKALYDLAEEQLRTAKQELPAFDETKKEVVYELGLCLEAMGR
ncbi:MAG: tetratricopeptide repeat protein, partial [Opitutaceae bacterium]|nr:tetratricopeptide repeat protein [Opitutaceae bacterium]